ncbi:hypothetical protein [Xenophilus azovorans]|uniref:hypothetical protein n=1 Tax=Xenophilus azovorans TaxID=151755 RepID=UPI00068C4A3A|nr:hypothetical protein [Xenophilus azovorans]
MKHILRSWTFWIRLELGDECREYLDRITLPRLRGAPGNLYATALFRGLPDGTLEVVVASVWENLESIRGHAGEDLLQPSVEPEVRAKMVDRDIVVRHALIDPIDPAAGVPPETLRGGLSQLPAA